jgi:hypothetical protein
MTWISLQGIVMMFYAIFLVETQFFVMADQNFWLTTIFFVATIFTTLTKNHDHDTIFLRPYNDPQAHSCVKCQVAVILSGI